MRILYFKNFTELFLSEFLQCGGAMFLFFTTRRIWVGFKDCDVIAQNLKGRSEGLGLRRFSACIAFKPQKSKVYLT